MRRGADPLNVQLWSERFARFEKSSQRVADFCLAEGVSKPSFYSWKRKLGVRFNGKLSSSRAKPATPSSSRAKPATMPPRQGRAFKRLQVTSGLETNTGLMTHIGGVTVRLPGGIEVDLGNDWATIEHVVDHLLDRQRGGEPSC